MLHETIRNDDFLRNTALQNDCCDIVSNGYNIVPTLQRCVAVKIVVANRSRVTSPILRNATALAQARPESNFAKLNERDMGAYGIAVLSFFFKRCFGNFDFKARSCGII